MSSLRRSRPNTVLDALNAVEDAHQQGYTFLSEDGSEKYLPFPQLLARARRRAGELQYQGLTKGDRLALVLADADDFVESFLGALLAGIVPVPLYPPFSLKNLRGYFETTGRMLAASAPKLLLASSGIHHLLWPLVERSPTLRKITTVERISERRAGAFAPVTVETGDTAFIQFTSGSTAEPRGVVVSHGNLVANSLALVRDSLRVSAVEQDRGLSWLPLYHDMGLIGFVISPLFGQTPVVFLPTFSFLKRPLLWLSMIERYRATITFAPSFAYSLVTARATEKDIAEMDLSRLRVAGCGAEPIAPAVMRAFVEKFAPTGLAPKTLLPCYGLAEATLAVTFTTPGSGFKIDSVDASSFRDRGVALPAAPDSEALHFVSCGLPLSEHRVRILDPRGREMPERAVGEIEVRGPSVSTGYFRNSAATARTFVDGGLRTGDLGYLGAGELYVTGRTKDLIIINGRNYHPQAIEWLVESLPGARKGNVVAFSRPRPGGGEGLIVACETRLEDRSALRAAIVGLIREELGLIAEDVLVLPPGTLPKTTSGKLRRGASRRRYLDGKLDSRDARFRRNQGATKALVLGGHMLRSVVSRVRHFVRSLQKDLDSDCQEQEGASK